MILNLAVWFALHTLFSEVRDLRFGMLHLDVPVLETLNVASLALTIAAMFAIFRLRIGMIPVLAGSAAAGIALRALAGTL